MEEKKFGAYHKINSIFKRDMSQKHKPFIMDKFTIPEFEYLQNNEWVFTEKIDGTNVRVLWQHETQDFKFGGRTDKAQMPPALMTSLFNVFQKDKFAEKFPNTDAIFYGEGYGGKIQKGNKYNEEETFVLFDVRIGPWWMERHSVIDIGCSVGIEVVPVVGDGTLHDGMDMVKNGLMSKWGDFEAEGIIARPKMELKARNGGRIITKIKASDFK